MINHIPILLYHSISDRATQKFHKYTLHPDQFASQVADLAAAHFQPMTVYELVKLMRDPIRPFPERPILLTFDDGFADFHSNVLPILSAYRFSATLFIPVAFIGKTSKWLIPEGEDQRQMLSWGQVAEIASEGIECGAHSLTHPELDTLSMGKAYREIFLSKQILEDHLGQSVNTFAYPHGYYNPDNRQMVRRAGYSAACAVKNAISSINDDPYALSRIIVTNGFSIDMLEKKLKSHETSNTPVREKIQTRVWRGVRTLNAIISQLQRENHRY